MGSDVHRYERVPSGSLGLDLILGGGWPVNGWHEIVGMESAGKTNLAFATVAANQRRDPSWTALWIAGEELSIPYAELCGVDASRLVIVNTNTMEEAYDAVLTFADERAMDCIVIDSLPSLVPRQELDGHSGDIAVGRHALLTGQMFRKSSAAFRRGEAERPILGLVINQYRYKIGLTFGDPRTTPGGKGKDYFYTTRVEVAHDGWVETIAKERIGQTVRAITKKNKSAPPQQRAFWDLYFDQGGPVQPGHIDYTKEVVTLAIQYDVLHKAGSWLSYGDQRWQGSTNAADALRSDTALRELLEQEIRNRRLL